MNCVTLQCVNKKIISVIKNIKIPTLITLCNIMKFLICCEFNARGIYSGNDA